jgi:hypothetical protein
VDIRSSVAKPGPHHYQKAEMVSMNQAAAKKLAGLTGLLNAGLRLPPVGSLYCLFHL